MGLGTQNGATSRMIRFHAPIRQLKSSRRPQHLRERVAMTQARSWLGTWCLAGDKNEVAGELTWGDGGAELVLFGSLLDSLRREPRIDLPLRSQNALIHGMTDAGPVSVLGANCAFPGFLGDGPVKESWRAEAVVHAEHVAPHDDRESAPRFRGVRFGLQHLPVWARANMPVQEFAHGKQVTVTAIEQTIATADLADVEIAIRQPIAVAALELGYSVAHTVFVDVTSTEPATWESLINEWLAPLQGLLWISTGYPSRTAEVLLRTEHDAEHWWWRPLSVSVIQPPGDGTRRIQDHRVLFHFDQLPGGFEAGLKRWFDIWKKYEHFLAPIVARDHAPFVYSNDRLLTTAAAIESYLDEQESNDLTTTERKVRVDRLCRLLQDEDVPFRTWALDAAEANKKKSFEERLIHLLKMAPTVTTTFTHGHFQLFTAQVRKARNGQAHSLQASKRGLLYGRKGALYLAAESLSWTIRALVLRDLGFDLEMAQGMVHRHDVFTNVANSMNEVLDEISSSAASHEGAS